MDILALSLEENKVDIACVTEHRMQEHLLQKLVIENYNTASSWCRASCIHGGTLILTRKDMHTIVLAEINNLCEDKIFEVCGISAKEDQAVYISVYRSPSACINTFFAKLEILLNMLTKTNNYKYIFISGDYNVNIMEINYETNTLLSIFRSFGCEPMSYEPSRETEKTATCVDNIFTNVSHRCTIRTLDLLLADHYGQIYGDRES